MAYTSSAVHPNELAFTGTKVAPKRARGLLGHLVDAMMAARLRQAEREVARYLADTGGKFTDEVEREIERRFLASPSRW